MKKYPKLEATRAYNADGTRMQCKHIPDLRILEFLYDHRDDHVIDWRNEYKPLCTYAKIANTYTVAGLFPAYVPQKLIRAKMNSLMRRGLIEGGDGSPSGNGNRVGSRFDARITEKGKKYVESITHRDLF